MLSADVHAVIQAHRRYLVELMQQWTRIKEDDTGSDLSMLLAVDAELFRLDSVYQVAGRRRSPRHSRGSRQGPEAGGPGEPQNPTRAPLPRHRREARQRG